MKIVCSGHLVRYPVGGFSWHHVQYLVGLHRLGLEVVYFEHFGWSNSCYDPARNMMTANPAFGLAYVARLFAMTDLSIDWCYIAENDAAYGMTRARLAKHCAQADLYLNLSNVNRIPELDDCARRVLIDTDPVFTQIRAHGLAGRFEDYHARFTYGENVHREECSMPTGGVAWATTRQPVVPDLWPMQPPPGPAPLTTLMNWSAYGAHAHDGRVYGQKDREFEPYFELPRAVSTPLELAVNAPDAVRRRLKAAGWRMADPLVVARTPSQYQAYIASSLGEFSVAKHAYVSTNSGWFSDRSCGYLASGRPVILQDTGFSANLPCGEGLLAFRTFDEAVAAIEQLARNYPAHCRAARAVAESCFDYRKVLGDLLEHALARA